MPHGAPKQEAGHGSSTSGAFKALVMLQHISHLERKTAILIVSESLNTHPKLSTMVTAGQSFLESCPHPLDILKVVQASKLLPGPRGIGCLILVEAHDAPSYCLAFFPHLGFEWRYVVVLQA